MSPGPYFLDQSENQKRQFIDAETVFLASTQAARAAAEVRGSMFWRDLRGRLMSSSSTAMLVWCSANT